MKIFGYNFFEKANTGSPIFDNPPAPPLDNSPTAYNNVWAVSYDGEKNLGEMGPVKKYYIDHESLRYRSWQLYLDSEICQTVFRRFSTWVIGKGLKLQSEPQRKVLEGEKISLSDQQIKDFIESAESRFKVYSGANIPDYKGMQSLHKIAKIAFINSIIGGDVLLIQRVIKGELKVQLIDAANICTPFDARFDGCDFYYNKTGNRIKHGVEIDATGRHIAYHVRTGILKYERISAYNRYGQQMATLIYGLTYRLDDVRGIPLIAAVMETASKMERYKEATLGSAEEAAKVPYTIVHDATSTGENPMQQQLARASGFNKVASGDNPEDVNHKKLLDKVAATTNKQAINMPIGAELKPIESKKEIYFKDFYTVNIDLVCATIGIPPEVALMKYDSNFSSSRAALKDWEHTLGVERADFSSQFYQPIYQNWLDIEILKNKITAPGYLPATMQLNNMALAAYRHARFVGANVPHIDPLKEVKAEREKLGSGGAHLPLTTLEAATESLNGGDAMANVIQYSDELKEADKAGIEKQQQQAIPQNNLTEEEG